MLSKSLKGKGKGVPVLFLTEHHALKEYWGSVGTTPPIIFLLSSYL